MKKLIIIILLAISSNVFSQDWPVKKLVTDKKAQRMPFVSIPSFSLTGNKKLLHRGTYQVLRLNTSFIKHLLEQRPEAVQVSIPLSNTETINCELVRFSLGNIKFTKNNDSVFENVKIPLTYRGIVSGEQKKNNVMLTVNENYLSLIAVLNDKTVRVTKTDNPDKSAYNLYNSDKIQFPEVPFECGTKDDISSQRVDGIELTGVQKRPNAPEGKCVNVFVECFDSLFQWKNNSGQDMFDYVYELFYAVATGYFNEQITIFIIDINLALPGQFRTDNRENALSDLAATYKDRFWGNICVGLDFSVKGPGKSGVAGGIGKAKAILPDNCATYTEEIGKNEFCYCDLNYNVSVRNFPSGPLGGNNATGQAIYLVMHEMGHLLGAHHTKWCGWKLTSNPDTYGPLDSCGGVEGSFLCLPGPPPPANGATIMSYCVSGNKANDFVNFNNGFGLLPGNAVRNFVNQTTCISAECIDCLVFNKKNNKKDAHQFVNRKLRHPPKDKAGVLAEYAMENNPKLKGMLLKKNMAFQLTKTK